MPADECPPSVCAALMLRANIRTWRHARKLEVVKPPEPVKAAE